MYYKLSTVPDSSGIAIHNVFVEKGREPDELLLQVRDFSNGFKPVAGTAFKSENDITARNLWQGLQANGWQTAFQDEIPPEILNHPLAQDFLSSGQDVWWTKTIDDPFSNHYEAKEVQEPFAATVPKFKVMDLRPFTLFGILIGVLMAFHFLK